MKIIRWFFYGLFIFIIVGAMIGFIVTPIVRDSYNTTMRDLDPSAANGNLVTAYNTKDDVYFDTYLPKDLKAKKTKQVGYILNVTYGTTSQKYSDGGYLTYSKEGETIDAQLIDCSTGEVIASQYFEAYFPEYVDLADELKVEPSVVAEWLTHVYPKWPAGKDVGHDYGPDGCSVCGYLPDQKESTVSQSAAEPTGPETKPAVQDPEAEAEKLVTGLWKLDFIMGGETFDIVPYDGEIKFQINKDHSASITTADEKYSYDWEYFYLNYEDNDPGKPIYNYLLTDKDGNELYFYYYYDNTIGIFTDEYSVFFYR